MSDLKNIDKLFQEKFEGFEATPDSKLWDQISSQLDERDAKKKRKPIVPFYYKLVGIAALLLLFITIGSQFINSTSETTNSKQQVTDSDENKNSNPNKNDVEKNTNSQLTGTSDETLKSNHKSNTNTVIDEKDRFTPKNSHQSNQHKTQNNTTVVANENTASNSEKNTTTVASNRNKLFNTNNQNLTETNNTLNNQNSVISNSTSVITKNNSTIKNTEIVQSDNSNSVSKNVTTTNTEKKEEVTHIEEEIAEEKTEDVKKSVLDVINELYDLEKESKEEISEKVSKWSIAPNAAPVYYNTIGNGSPIDNLLVDNAKEGGVNLSYGLNVAYDVSNKFTIRSGIHKVDYSYDTNDVTFIPTTSDNNINAIASKSEPVNFLIQDSQVSSRQIGQDNLAILESSIRQTKIDGKLTQQFSYIEVPLELKYKVVDNKIGVNVIGGVSTLVLTNNRIILDAPEITTELGEANNLNNVSFSTNIGLGIDYEVSKQLEFNLEPMLKYQVNTFSGNSGSFKPYSVGVYTGISFRF